MEKNVLKQAWLVLVLAVCFGAALAGVHVGLSGRIEANRRADGAAGSSGRSTMKRLR